MKETLRNIIYMARRFKTATTLNMIGLVVAFATFYLLITQITQQVTYNHGIDDYERLYRLESDYLYNEDEGYSDNVCSEFCNALDSMPLVESYSMAVNIKNGDYTLEVKKDTVLEIPYTWGNNTAISTLTRQVLDGDISLTKDDPAGIIIPACIAIDYFGTTQAAGKEIMLYPDTTERYKVRGVFEDFPENSELWNCIYMYDDGEYWQPLNCEYKCIIKFSEVPHDLDSWTDSLKQVIIRQTLKVHKEKKVDETEINVEMKDLRLTSFTLTPLKNSLFKSTSFTSSGTRSFQAMLFILMLMCLIVIIIATFNFLNFFLAESPMRIRSLNTRLVLGAQRHTLRKGMVTECVVTSLAACLIALAACAIFVRIPLSGPLFAGNMALSAHPWLIVLMMAIAVVVGVLAGAYPAIFATSFQPAMALKGTFGLTPQGIKLRTVIVGLQLFFSLLMVSYGGILFLQRHYIFHSDYGYNKNQILTCELISDTANTTLRNRLFMMPEVQNVAFSDAVLGSTDTHNAIKTSSQNNNMTYRYIVTDSNYLRTMGIKMAEGRSFTPDDSAAVIINKAARQQWHWIDLGDNLSISIGASDSSRIVGVSKDIRYATTRINNDKPFVFVLKNANMTYPALNLMNVLVAPEADKEQVRQQVNKLVKEIFNNKKRVQNSLYFDKILEKTYIHELRYINLIVFVSIICLIITLIGLFCITMFETEYRRKEIGIRKVAGATTGEIVKMLCQQYGWLILISFIASIPFACLGGYLSLKHFAEHTAIQWWIFPLSLLVVGAITLGTVILKSWRSARENPTVSLKND